jgi:hypothetical protein
MQKLARIIPIQLRLLHYLIKEQTLRVPLMKRDALTSGVSGAALVAAAFEGAVGFLLDDLGVVAGNHGEAGDGAEGEARCVCLGLLDGVRRNGGRDVLWPGGGGVSKVGVGCGEVRDSAVARPLSTSDAIGRKIFKCIVWFQVS